MTIQDIESEWLKIIAAAGTSESERAIARHASITVRTRSRSRRSRARGTNSGHLLEQSREHAGVTLQVIRRDTVHPFVQAFCNNLLCFVTREVDLQLLDSIVSVATRPLDEESEACVDLLRSKR